MSPKLFVISIYAPRLIAGCALPTVVSKLLVFTQTENFALVPAETVTVDDEVNFCAVPNLS